MKIKDLFKKKEKDCCSIKVINLDTKKEENNGKKKENK